MKKSIIVLIVLSLALTGCSTLKGINNSLNEESKKRNCLTLPNNKVVENFDKIKNIAIEEAKNNGFEELNNDFIKPSKYNDWKGQMSFYHDAHYKIGSEYLKLRFDKNDIWFSTDAAEADGKTAITAMKDRISKL